MPSSPHIQVKVHRGSSRYDYIFDIVLTSWLGMAYDIAEGGQAGEIQLKAMSISERQVCIPELGILSNQELGQQSRMLIKEALEHFIQDTKPLANLPVMDIIFYFLSGMDQTMDDSRDAHGRFSYTQSLLREMSLLDRPILDELLLALRTTLKTNLGLERSETHPYQFVSTIDVDYPWYARHLTGLRRLKRLKSLSGTDPFDTFDFIIDLHEKHGHAPLFFMSPPASSSLDFIQRYNAKAYAQLVSNLSGRAMIGLHPSYHAAENVETLQSEVRWFEGIVEEPLMRSRQHYLRLLWPQTPRLLVEAGVRHDYSTGFAGYAGFASGTARPFAWYDLERETTTPLILHSTLAMDVTLRQYMKCSPEHAMDHLKMLQSQVQTFGGEFVLLWHNSSLSAIEGWQNYAEVYRHFISNS